MSGQPIVELHDVFSVHRSGQGDAAALQGADLEVAAGETLCVLGPSGAGKSTLLRVIAGLQTPSAGVVQVMGADIGRRGERARAALRQKRTQNIHLAPQCAELKSYSGIRARVYIPIYREAAGGPLADMPARADECPLLSV